MIWNEPKECMSRDEMNHLQSTRLRDLVQRVYHNVEFYRKKMQELGIEPDDIHGIEDLGKLPFTKKQDLRDNYPFGLFAVPKSEIVRVHASSGTTGKSTVVGYTRKDVNTFAEVVARSLASAGATKDDFVQVAYGYGLFTGGLGLHYGAEKLGAAVIPISGGNTAKQLQLLEDFWKHRFSLHTVLRGSSFRSTGGSRDRRGFTASSRRRFRSGTLDAGHARQDRGRPQDHSL